MEHQTLDTGTIKEQQIESLIPYARNARTHEDAQVAQIAASIREFGFNNPVLIDGKNNIIAGHGRVLAARKLGMTGVPCVVLDHMTPEQQRAYVIADNQIALNAGWDTELLSLEVVELGGLNVDLSLLGFDAVDLIDILGNEPELGGMPGLPDGDRAPFQVMTFTLHDDQAEQVKAALDKAKAMGEFDGSPNENSNGNALALVCGCFNGG